MSELRIEAFKEGDENAVIYLFERAFGKKLSPDLWRWKFQELPRATDHVILLKDGRGDIHGHIAVLPLPMRYKGRDIPGGIYVDFMVDPDSVKKGAGGLLLKAMIDHLRKEFSLAYGFPNPNAIRISRSKGPVYLGEIPIYWRIESGDILLKGLGPDRKALSGLSRLAGGCLRMFSPLLYLSPLGGRKFNVEIVDKCCGNLEGLETASRDGCGIFVVRDEPFLAWRFDRHPDAVYVTLLLVEKGRGRKPIGYMVLAIREFFGSRIGFIMDVMVKPPAFGPVRFLLSHAVRWFREEKVEAISCIMMSSNSYTRALSSLGFIRIPQRFLPGDLHMVVRVNDPEIDHDYVSNPSNWFLTWADTDLV